MIPYLQQLVIALHPTLVGIALRRTRLFQTPLVEHLTLALVDGGRIRLLSRE